MGKTFEEYLASVSPTINTFEFLINLILTAFLAAILSWVYARYGNALSNRKLFSRNFILLSMTTMLVITIVKSSLALSLGLVGALSIVRFRAAIKEPEELGFLFLAIAIGLGMGANQVQITFVAILSILAIIIIVKRFSSGNLLDEQNLHLIIGSNQAQTDLIEEIIEILQKYCIKADLKRLDETKENLEASFLIELDNFTELNELKKDLRSLDHGIEITLIDNQNLL